MGAPDRLPGASHFSNEMIALHLLMAGGASDVNDCLERERNGEIWVLEGLLRR